jgi:glycogen(starch) synthase
MFDDLRHVPHQRTDGASVTSAAPATGRVPSFNELLPEFTGSLKRSIHAWRNPKAADHRRTISSTTPASVLRHLHTSRHSNAEDDPVKFVFHPEFVTQTGPLIDLDYAVCSRVSPGHLPQLLQAWGHADGMHRPRRCRR